jgi:hypothetical protein
MSTTLATHVTPSPDSWTTIDGVPGAWRRLRTRVAVSARAADGLRVDGRLVDGLQVLRSDRSACPSVVTVAGLRVDVLDAAGVSEAPQLRIAPA